MRSIIRRLTAPGPAAALFAAILALYPGASRAGASRQSTSSHRAASGVESGAAPPASALAHAGVLHFRRREFPQAIADLSKAAQLAPGNKAAVIYLARTYAANGQNEKAIGTLKAWMNSHGQDADALYWIGQFYRNLAEATFQEMAKANPHSYLVYEAEGKQLRARQQYTQALAAYQKALAVAPKGVPGLHFYLGDIYWRELQYDKAREELQQELSLNPNHAKANYELGDIDVKQGKAQEAILRLQKALAADPGLIEAHRALGRAYVLEKRYAEAVSEFQQVARADPSDHTIHAQLATTYRHLGRLKEAKQEAELSQRLESHAVETIQSNKAAEQKLGSHP